MSTAPATWAQGASFAERTSCRQVTAHSVQAAGTVNAFSPGSRRNSDRRGATRNAGFCLASRRGMPPGYRLVTAGIREMRSHQRHGGDLTVFGGLGDPAAWSVPVIQQGWQVRVAVRRPTGAVPEELKMSARQTLLVANIRDGRSVHSRRTAPIVVNLVGILFQPGPQHFDTVQAAGPAGSPWQAKAAGSGGWCMLPRSAPTRNRPWLLCASKGGRRAAVRQKLSLATIPAAQHHRLRTGWTTSTASRLALISPVLPLIRGRFDEVPAGLCGHRCRRGGDARAGGRCDRREKYNELGGPRVYSFPRTLGNMRCSKSINADDASSASAMLQAAFLQLLPNPMLTVDQVRLLKRDSVVSSGVLTLKDLGIAATAMDVVLPTISIAIGRAVALQPEAPRLRSNRSVPAPGMGTNHPAPVLLATPEQGTNRPQHRTRREANRPGHKAIGLLPGRTCRATFTENRRIEKSWSGLRGGASPSPPPPASGR